MLANELIARSLRLINVPGQGATLAPSDQTAGFEALQEILDSSAVTKMFVPGIRTHFFPMSSGKSIYTYGVGPSVELRSDDFDEDPAPITIEDAFIRGASSITNNEQVDEYRFEATGDWVPSGTAQIVNNQAGLIGIGAITQALALTIGKTYTLRFTLEVTLQDVVLQIQENAVDVLNLTFTSSGQFTFDFPITDILPTITFTTADAGDDVSITFCSILEQGLDRLALPDGVGSDYYIDIIDQTRYNDRFSKGKSGRPYELLYSRSYPVSKIFFDNSSLSGDILVMDVLVNQVGITSLNSTLRIHPDAIQWLRYELANVVAGEYGKELKLSQLKILDDAWDSLAAGNLRMNTLKVDPALLNRPSYDINRGDP